MQEIVDFVNQYGFPITAAAGMGYCIYYLWKWVTKVMNPKLAELHETSISLIDQIRLMDNDIIRLNEKLNIVNQLRKRPSNDEQR